MLRYNVGGSPTDVSKFCQLGPAINVTPGSTWLTATPTPAITPTPPGPAILYAATSIGGGQYNLTFSQPITFAGTPGLEQNIIGWSPSLGAWIPFTSVTSPSTYVATVDDTIAVTDISKFVLLGTPNTYTSPYSFTRAAPVTPIT